MATVALDSGEVQLVPYTLAIAKKDDAVKAKKGSDRYVAVMDFVKAVYPLDTVKAECGSDSVSKADLSEAERLYFMAVNSYDQKRYDAIQDTVEQRLAGLGDSLDVVEKIQALNAQV